MKRTTFLDVVLFYLIDISFVKLCKFIYSQHLLMLCLIQMQAL